MTPMLTGTRQQVPSATFFRLATQFENAGDCLLARELLRLAAEHGDVYVDAYGCPPKFAQQAVAGIDPRRVIWTSGWRFFPQMLRLMPRGRQCYWFLAPGAVSGDGPQRSRVNRLVRDLAVVVTSMAGVRVCQVGASFENLSAQHLRTWRRRRSRLFLLSPRDTLSAEYLASQGIPCDPVIPDLAFNLFSHAATGETQTDKDTQHVCLSFRTDQYAEQAHDVHRLAQRLCVPNDLTRQVTLLVQVARDRRGMQALAARLATAGVRIGALVDVHDDVEECLRFYQGVSLVISNRLHVLLMAASRGARVLALVEGPGGRKLRGVLRDVGLEHALIDQQTMGRLDQSSNPGVAISGTAERERLRRGFDELLRAGAR